MENYIHRFIERTFLELSDTFSVVLVCGPRQCGKTTMLKHLSENHQRSYVSLDDIDERSLAEKDPHLFFQIHKPPIIIDEIQYVPSLFEYIKTIVDKNKIPGEFWLTGSQKYELMKNVRESLAGRIAIIEMSPLMLDEIEGKQHKIEMHLILSFYSLKRQTITMILMKFLIISLTVECPNYTVVVKIMIIYITHILIRI